MSDINYRLECLKLAVEQKAVGTQAVDYANEYAEFVLKGNAKENTTLQTTNLPT